MKVYTDKEYLIYEEGFDAGREKVLEEVKKAMRMAEEEFAEEGDYSQIEYLEKYLKQLEGNK